MIRFKALVGLNMFCDIGSARLKKLLEVFGTPENILRAPARELSSAFGIGEKIAAKVASLKEKDIDEELRFAAEHKLKVITIDDKDYPESLKNIPDPPIVLYVKGELREEDKFSLGIVGSRRASFYGLTSAEKFAGDLTQKGMTIVSGLARGIDTAAHKGALKSGGRTIAVIGSGFHYLYPSENSELAEEISQNGAVVSEFPVKARPLPQNFPRRNRLISGLSLGVLVVEAAQNSGALITADCALEQGREVFALPGKIDSANSFGTNGLIKQGAKLVECADDIIEELEPILKSKIQELKINQPEPEQKKQMPIGLGLTEEEALLYSLLSEEPLLLDEISEKAGMGIPQLASVVFKLQMRRLIRQLPGRQFIKA
jgi:DNA processing protein